MCSWLALKGFITDDCNASTLLVFGVAQKNRIGIFKKVGREIHGRPIYKRQTDKGRKAETQYMYTPSPLLPKILHFLRGVGERLDGFRCEKQTRPRLL